VIGALSRFGRFWWDFVVGDDWRIAAGIVVLGALAAAAVHWSTVRTGAIAVALPVAIVALAAVAILRDARR
jgi:hypothetical protein